MKIKFIIYSTVLFIIEIILIHFIYKSKDLLATPLSEYGTGKYGLIICSGLVLIGINYLLLSFSLLIISNRSISLKIGSSLLLLVGISTLILAVFQTDVGTVYSLRGKVHLTAAYAHFIILPYAAICISLGLLKDENKYYKLITLLFGIICIITGTALSLKDYLKIGPIFGIVQKLLIIIILFWIIYSANHLFKLKTKRV